MIAGKNTVRLVCSVALVKSAMVPSKIVAKIVGRWFQSMNYNAWDLRVLRS